MKKEPRCTKEQIFMNFDDWSDIQEFIKNLKEWEIKSKELANDIVVG